MKKTFLATICLLAGMNIHAQQIDIQPTPQQVKAPTHSLDMNGIG